MRKILTHGHGTDNLINISRTFTCSVLLCSLSCAQWFSMITSQFTNLGSFSKRTVSSSGGKNAFLNMYRNIFTRRKLKKKQAYVLNFLTRKINRETIEAKDPIRSALK